MPEVNSGINWGASLKLNWRLVEMDSSMWEPGEAVGGVVSASIMRDVGGALLESGSVTVEAPSDYEPAEFWGRLEVIAEQGDVVERWPVATMLMTPGDVTVNRGRKLIPYDCSSVLKAAADVVLPTGYSVPANSDGAAAAAEILAVALPCPVYSYGSFTLDEGLVMSGGTSRLDAAQMLVDAAGWCIQVDNYGAVAIREVPSAPSLVLDSSTASLLCTEVKAGGASYDLPTAYIAVDGLETARAEVSSLRPVEIYDDSPKLVNGELLQDYAERMLSELRNQTYSRSYKRSWVPGLTVFDVVDGNLPEAGLDARMHITSQRFTLGGEFVVEEVASVSPKGRSGLGVAAEIEKMLAARDSERGYMAVVLRTDSSGITWVSIPGGADEMPLYGTFAELEPGDVVQVTIVNGRAVVTGNSTSPSVGQRWVNSAIAPITMQVGEFEDSVRIAVEIAEEAEGVATATGQHFWTRDADPDHDGAGTGAFVTDDEREDFLEAAAAGFPDLGDGTGNTKPWHNLLMNSLGILLRTGLNNLVSITRSAIAFFDGNGNQAGNIVASFGKDGAQIGKSGESHVELDFRSMSLVDKGGDSYFEVKDLRDASGYAEVSESFVGEGMTWMNFALTLPIDSPSGYQPTVTVDGSAVIYEIDENANTILLPQLTPSGSKIVVTYKTRSSLAKAATFGRRSTGSDTGAMSTALGDRVEASGLYSYAEGSQTKATGRYSHAEGRMTEAFAMSHAEGVGTKAINSATHAQNDHTIAASDSQTALGKYNVEDANGTYAVIVGNGTSDSARSDALTVDWSGNVECGTVNGVDVASIGTTATPVSTTTSVTSGNNVDVASINLAAGTWMVCAKVQFPSNATGRRAVKLSTSSQESGNVVSTNVQTAVSGATMQMSTSRCFTLASAGTVYLVAWQNSGGALSCVGDIEATRIC